MYVAVATMFDSIDGRPYFIVKIPQVGAKMPKGLAC